jgi:propanol-preferring alcohol dehydrogenase
MLPLPAIPLRALAISGSCVGSRPELIELMDLAGQGQVARVPITKRPLSEVNEALVDLREGRQVGRAVLTP